MIQKNMGSDERGFSHSQRDDPTKYCGIYHRNGVRFYLSIFSYTELALDMTFYEMK
jgi:hypothetical protein